MKFRIKLTGISGVPFFHPEEFDRKDDAERSARFFRALDMTAEVEPDVPQD